MAPDAIFSELPLGTPSPPVATSKPAPSFRNNFAARFLADSYGLATSLIAATLTARVLGPSGRGYYASLTLLSLLFAQIFSAGLGEAAVVLPGLGRATAKTAFASTTAMIVPLSIIGAVFCIVIGSVTLRIRTRADVIALVLAGLLVLLNTCSNTFAWFLASRERLVLVSLLTILSATVATASLYVLIVVLNLGTAGAILASVVGIAATLLALALVLPREGISLRAKWNREYLRTAARFGMALQFSNILVQMTGRLDLLFVYRIAGAAPAGMYSVALTVGALVGSVPIAIAYAFFPRLPKLEEDEARALAASLFRAGAVAALFCAVALALIAPFAFPLVFGSAYDAALVPTLLLLPGGVLWSAQWILCRAAAARHAPQSLLVSFALSFFVMIVLDLVLISPFGMIGAASASVIGSATGFLLSLVYFLRSGQSWRLLVPRPADVVALLTTLRRLLASIRPQQVRTATNE